MTPHLGEHSWLFDQTECKDDFLIMGKEAIKTKDFGPIHSYFDSHTDFIPLHCLFVRKVTKLLFLDY